MSYFTLGATPPSRAPVAAAAARVALANKLKAARARAEAERAKKAAMRAASQAKKLKVALAVKTIQGRVAQAKTGSLKAQLTAAQAAAKRKPAVVIKPMVMPRCKPGMTLQKRRGRWTCVAVNGKAVKPFLVAPPVKPTVLAPQTVDSGYGGGDAYDDGGYGGGDAYDGGWAGDSLLDPAIAAAANAPTSPSPASIPTHRDDMDAAYDDIDPEADVGMDDLAYGEADEPPPPAPTVVVTAVKPPMSGKTKMLIAGAAGAALLMFGL